MRKMAIAFALVAAVPAAANDWEKFYTALPAHPHIQEWAGEPQKLSSSGDFARDIQTMWENGFALRGYTAFNSGNSKTNDAMKFAKKLKVQYVIVATDLTSSSTSSIPLTTPTATTTTVNGNVYNPNTGNTSVSGTATTYGSKTTYIPITVNRFEKVAGYFAPMAHRGSGVLPRAFTAEEISTAETARGFAVVAVRKDSPAYLADLLPGDLVVKINGQPYSEELWLKALTSEFAADLTVIRKAGRRELKIVVPADWR